MLGSRRLPLASLPAGIENRPGPYLVGLYDDELIGIEGGALPPPSEIP